MSFYASYPVLTGAGGGNSFGSILLTGSSSGALTLTVPAAVTSYTMVFPAVQGAVGSTLINDGSGNLSWQVAGGITIGTIDSQVAVANGLQIISNVLYAQYATASVPGMVSTGTQTFAGAKTFTGAITASNLSGTNTGNVTLTAVGATPNANGASLSGQALTLQPADATFPGVLTAADWSTFNAKQAAGAYITALTGDVTASGPGSATATLATVATAGTFTKVTINVKGLVTTGATAVLASADFANQGTTTTVLHGNAAGNPSWAAVSLTADVTGTLPIANGGTGQTAANAGFNALSPMTTGGDLIYGGASGVATRLANGLVTQVLTSAGGTAAPTWSFPSVSAVKTTTYPITTSDEVVLVDGTSAFTTTLPTAVGFAGKKYTIKRVDQTLANAVTIATTSSQTIDGVTTRKLMTQYEQFTVVSDGANWQVSAHSYPEGWTAYTMTITGTGSDPTKGTTSVDSARWKRTGDSVEIAYDYVQTAAGSDGTGRYLYVLPSGLTIDTAKQNVNTSATTQFYSVGSGIFSNVVSGLATTSAVLSVEPYDSTHLSLAADSTGTAATMTVIGQTGYGELSLAKLELSFRATVPITNWEP